MKLSLFAIKKYFFLIAIVCLFNLNAGSFKLASWNILAEWAYQAHAEKPLMPFKNGRETLILKNLKELSDNKVDIICLQEVDMRKGSEGPTIKTHLETLHYTVITPTTVTSQATIIAYNKNFKGTNPYEITLQNKSLSGTKQCVTETVFLTHNKTLPSIKVISLHLPYEPGKTEQDALDNLGKNVLNHTNKPGFSIICGDFNYTTYSSDPQDKLLNYNKLIDSQHFNVKLWDDAGLKHGFHKTGSAYSQALKRMDYIFYTKTFPASKYRLTCTKYEQVPLDLTRLIKHTNPKTNEEKSYYDFPSDHAILIAEFEIIDTSKETLMDTSESLNQLGQALNNLKSTL